MTEQATPTAAGASHSAVMQVLARVVALLLIAGSTALITRELGDGYVNWATVLSALAIAGVLVEPGLSPVVMRHLALDSTGAPRTSAMLPVRLVLGLLAFVLVLGIAVSTRGLAVLPLAALMGASVLARAVVNNATPWLQTDQRLHRATLLETATAALGFGALVLGILLGLPTPVLGFLTFTGPTILLALLVSRELARTPSARLPSPGAQWPKVRLVVREALPLAGSIILATTYMRTSVAFVNAYEDDGTASRFFFAFLFAEQTIAAAGIAAGAVLPLLAGRSRTVALLTDDVMHQLLVTVAAIGSVVSAGLILAAHLLTVVIGGPALAGAETYIYLTAPVAALVFPAMVLAYAYIAVGRGRWYLVFGVLGLAGNLVLNVLFTPEHGAAASSRITWATEGLVLLIPLVWVAAASASGRRAATQVVLLLAGTVLASELAAADRAPALALGAGLVALVLLVAGRSVLWAARTIAAERRAGPPVTA